jgi:serine/threonine protein phosphatase 1
VIGDVHGRIDLLEILLARISDDDASRPEASASLIFLGDLIDRGPASAEVVERVKGLCEGGIARLIKGNHEEAFIEACKGHARGARALISIGGLPTIRSYGISEAQAKAGSFSDLADLLASHIPRAHIDFLDSGEDQIQIGDYLFVHAGICPGVPFHEQVPDDLRWIRNEFLRSELDHGAMIVHGHTITETVDEKPNRIGIDTGAFRTGILTAMGLEKDQRWFLTATGASDETLDTIL